MHGQPSILRRWNQRLVFEHLWRGGPASRAELAKATGLSAPTVGKMAQSLLEAGLLEEADEGQVPASQDRPEEPAATMMGRPARTLRLNQGQAVLVTLQVGVRHTRVAALPVAGPLEDDRWAVEFDTTDRAGLWHKKIERAAQQLGVSRPWAVMVSVPGVVDEEQGSVLLSPNLHWIEQADLPALVGRVWPGTTMLVQEIRALALGQLVAEPTCEDFLLVDVGEGVGGAVVMHGRLVQSPLPLSGELGHTPVLGNQRQCGCGARGCVETLISRRGLVESFVAAHPHQPGTLEALARRVAQAGIDPWLGDSLDAAALTIAGALNVTGVREVIVTGALTELPPLVMERLGQGVERAAMWARFGSIVCRAARRRRAAGLVAAAIDRVLLPGLSYDLLMGGRDYS